MVKNPENTIYIMFLKQQITLCKNRQYFYCMMFENEMYELNCSFESHAFLFDYGVFEW